MIEHYWVITRIHTKGLCGPEMVRVFDEEWAAQKCCKEWNRQSEQWVYIVNRVQAGRPDGTD